MKIIRNVVVLYICIGLLIGMGTLVSASDPVTEYVLNENFDARPQNFDIAINDIESSGHYITFEDGIAAIHKAGDLGVPEISTSQDAFSPVYGDVVMQIRANITEGQFTLYDNHIPPRPIINFYTRSGYDQLEMRLSAETKYRIGYRAGDWITLAFVINRQTELFYVYKNDDTKPLNTNGWSLMGATSNDIGSNVSSFAFKQRSIPDTTSYIDYVRIWKEPGYVVGQDIAYLEGEYATGIASLEYDFKLPQKAPNGSNLKWESNNPEVLHIDENGGVTLNRPSYGAGELPVTLVVYLLYNGHTADTTLSVMVLQMLTDEAKADKTYEMMDFVHKEYMFKDFALPLEGKDGTVIAWSSSDDTVIIPLGDKAVVIPKQDMETKVTLTAEIISGAVKRVKEFEFHVLPYIGENLINADGISASSQILSNLAKSAADDDFNIGWKPVVTQTNPYLLMDLGADHKGISHFRFRVLDTAPINYVLEKSDDNAKFIPITSGSTTGTSQLITLPFDPMCTSRYLRLKLDNTDQRDLGIYEVQALYAPTDRMITKADAKGFSFTMISYEDISKVTKNLTLITKGVNGSDISYTADSKYLRIEGGTGTITRPTDGNKTVPLMVNFKKGEDYTQLNLNLTILASQIGNNNNGGGGGNGGSSGSGGAFVFRTVPQPQPQLEKPSSGEEPFVDLVGYDWAKTEILALADENIIAGDGNGNFFPGDEISREEMVALLVNAFYADGTSAEISLEDVPKESWYYAAIRKATAAGVVKGMDEYRFGVGRKITRQEATAMMYRIAAPVLNVQNNGQSVTFSDSGEIADYAVEAVERMYKLGIINGMGGNLFAPRENMTRAQTAVMIYKLMAALGRK